MTKYEGDPDNLIREIHEKMSPEQVIENIRLYHELEHNSSRNPTDAARIELLKRSGYEPKDWLYFTNFVPIYGEKVPNDKDLEMLGSSFPPEIEFLILQGAVIGGMSNPRSNSFHGAKYIFHENEYSVFVRVRKQLK